MSLVKHPKLFVAEIGGTDNLIIEQFAFARDISIELFVEERYLEEVILFREGSDEAVIYLSFYKSLFDVLRLHLCYADIQFRIFLHQLRKEAGQQVRGDGGEYT